MHQSLSESFYAVMHKDPQQSSTTNHLEKLGWKTKILIGTNPAESATWGEGRKRNLIIIYSYFQMNLWEHVEYQIFASVQQIAQLKLFERSNTKSQFYIASIYLCNAKAFSIVKLGWIEVILGFCLSKSCTSALSFYCCFMNSQFNLVHFKPRR